MIFCHFKIQFLTTLLHVLELTLGFFSKQKKKRKKKSKSKSKSCHKDKDNQKLCLGVVMYHISNRKCQLKHNFWLRKQQGLT
jgi:hypothetical protein